MAEEKRLSEIADETDFSELRILFFIEKKTHLQHFKTIFRMCGFKHVQEATRLSEAINYLISRNYDLIMITHFGNNGDADLLIEEVKGIEGTAEIPLAVVTTAQGGAKNILSLYYKGVDEVMVSPLSYKMVESTITDIITEQQEVDPLKRELDMAQDCLRIEEFEKAGERFTRLINNEAHLFHAYLGMYQVYKKKQDWQTAATHLKRAFEIAKTQSDGSLLEKAKLYRDLATVYHNFGDLYHKRGNAEKALKYYRFAIKLNPFNIESIIATLGFMRSPEEAVEITKLLDEISKNFVPFSNPLEKIAIELEKLADKFIDLNMFDNAMAVHQQLKTIPHGNAVVCLKNADFLLEQGDISSVMEMLIDFSMKITDHDVLVKAASIFMDVEKDFFVNDKLVKEEKRPQSPNLEYFKNLDREELITKAKEMYKQALLIEPDNTICWVDILRCYIRLKSEDKARELAEKLVRTNQEDEALLAEMIKALLDNDAFELVAPFLKDAMDRFPDNGTFYEYQAVFYKKQNKPYEAISFLKKSYHIQPERGELLILLGETYFDLKDYSNAIVFYEKAAEQLENDPRVEKGLQKALQAKHG